MNVPGDAAGDVAVTHAVGENDSGDIVAAREDGGEVAAGVAAGRDSDDVSLETCQFQGAMGFFVSGPQLHAAKRASHRLGAWYIFGVEFLEFHERPYAGTGKIRGCFFGAAKLN